MGRGRAELDNEETDPSPEEHLESFMDKLAMWQLLSEIDNGNNSRKISVQAHSTNPKTKENSVDERDWFQIFVEDIIETQCVA